MADRPKRAAASTSGTASGGGEGIAAAAGEDVVAGAPPNSHLDDALFVPRLEQLVSDEAALDAGEPGYGDLLESICGAIDDSQPVEQYDGTLGVPRSFVDANERAVVQVQWNDDLGSSFTVPGDVNGVRWGSGTMISPDLMLTCGHLFDQTPTGWSVPRQNGTTQPISPQEIARNMHVNFGHQVDPAGNLRAEQSFAITDLVEYRLGGIDMAVCRIAGNPGTTFGWTQVSQANAALSDMIVIIGHPAGRPKRIEAGPTTTVANGLIRYNDIDTLGGNSGSGILHGTSGALVGVHTNGGCNPGGTGSNFGQAIETVRAVSPTLQTLNVGTSIAADLLGTPLSDDLIGTGLAADLGTDRSLDTHRVADLIGTSFGADTPFAQDRGTPLGRDTRQASDVGTAFAGDVGTRLAGDFGTGLLGDINTGPGDDPNNTLRETIVDPGKIDPGVIFSRQVGVARPFVQAGPHIPLAEFGGQPGPGDGGVSAAEAAVQAVLDLQQLVAAQREVLDQVELSLAQLIDSLGL